MKEIKLTKGFVALVDDDDYERVNQFKWQYTISRDRKTAYAIGLAVDVDGKKKILNMHVFITGKRYMDHKDRNGLNNQKDNLRKATASQNMANRVLKPCLSNPWGYKGVGKMGKKWRARINHYYKNIHLGVYDCPHTAAIAYNKKALEFWDEFAILNIIQN